MKQQSVSQNQPQQAIVLKLSQRQRQRKSKRPSQSVNQWQPHKGDAALDAWGTALRTMKAQGLSWE